MDANKLVVVEFLYKYVVACFDEVVVACFDKNSKEYYDVYFLLTHPS